MKSTARLGVCAVATLALVGAGVGVGTDAQAQAAPRHGTAQHHTRIEHDGSTRVLRALGHLERRLDHATRSKRLAPLTDADRAALQTNAAVDEAAVEAAATAYSAHPSGSTLAAAKDVLKGYHPQRYVAATNILRHSERTAAQIAALQTLVAPGGDEETALAAATDLLSRASATGFSATTNRSGLHAARHAAAHARALVGQVRAALTTP